MIILKSELERILNTGWQSWSWNNPNKTIFRFPLCCYPPQKAIAPEKLEVSFKLKKPVRGWCSFYAFGTRINEEKILNQISTLRQNGLTKFEYILIDDGWTKWGDWLEVDKNKFQKGMRDLAATIKEAGFKPGIWIAPFLVSPKSSIVKKHSNWIVQDSKGNYVEGLHFFPGNKYLPSKKFILDLKNPEVKKYLKKVLAFLLDTCKFSLIKLDWLYGIYYDPALTVTEADNILREFLQGIKEKYPDLYTIACGSPLLPALGVVDSMRIGPDILIPSVQNIPFLKSFTNKFLYKKALHNFKSRKWTRKYWNIDLDVFCCSGSLGFSEEEIIKFQRSIIQSKGNIFLGDDISKLSKDHIKKFIYPLIS